MGNFYIETDCQTLITALKSHSQNFSYFSSIVMECVDGLEAISNASFGFVKRSANNAAHCLARVVCSLSDFGEWSQAPPFLSSVLAVDME